MKIKHLCTYTLLHKPEFSTVNALMAVTSRVNLHDLVNLTLSVFFFYKVFLKL